MPVYLITDSEAGIDQIIVAPSERAARLHLMRHATCRVIRSHEIATLAAKGVPVEILGQDVGEAA
jgi:hypothetical protein